MQKKWRILCMFCMLSVLCSCGNTEQAAKKGRVIPSADAEQSAEYVETEDEIADPQELLTEAASLIEEKKYPQAIALLSGIEGNAQAEDWLQQLRYLISGDYIANLGVGVAAINENGNVIVRTSEGIYEIDPYSEVQEWENIRRLSFADDGLDALNWDGMIFTTVSNRDTEQRNEQLETLTDIKLFSTGNSNYAAVDETGKLYVYNKFDPYLEYPSVQGKMQNWKNIVDAVTGSLRVAVLQGDGTVSFVYTNKVPGDSTSIGRYANIYDDMEEWTDIVDISGKNGMIAGLRADGTVVVSHHMIDYGTDYFEVSEWTDIIAISKSYKNILGLKRDGTVVTAGLLNEKQKEVSEWTDIVAISAGQDFHIGLKSDGTLVIAGEIREGEYPLPDVSDVSNLYVPTVDLQ